MTPESRVAPAVLITVRTIGSATRPASATPHVELPGLGELANPREYLARHSRSFRFAASLMARGDRARIARVYAWCRYTDNLVDDDVSTDLAERRLERWLARSRDAYEGRDSGIELVNRVMGEMAEQDISFTYARDLVRAMRCDLDFTPYADLDALRVYTYRAAGVVGRWLTELHGVRDPWMLDRATALGRAMQLTNILRDVGEDLERGRMYLPVTELRRHGLSVADIDAIQRGTRAIDAPYRALIEDLMAVAQSDYQFADQAIGRLPREFRRAAAVASAVYQGIHRAIRRNRYDNIRRRAYTTQARKTVLAAGALLSLAVSRVGRMART
jgi:15-cis-phytoene synthase